MDKEPKHTSQQTLFTPKAIENGRRGRYVPQKVQKIPQAFLDKYFVYQNRHYAIRQQVKDVVTFQVFNLIRLDTPPVSDVHIMFCRNVLMYFDRPAQVRLITELTHLLAPGGYLFLGDAESLHTYHHIADEFEMLESGDAIIYQKRGAHTS